MNNSVSKGSEPFTLKAFIIIMSLVYILGPAHLEVNKLLHAIAHTLQMPDTILSHQNHSEVSKIHNSNEHKNVVIQHDHKIIKIVERILEGTDNGNESPDTPNKLNKIDKHIKIYDRFQNKRKLTYAMKVKHYFIEKEDKLCKGYPNGYKKPPQV